MKRLHSIRNFDSYASAMVTAAFCCLLVGMAFLNVSNATLSLSQLSLKFIANLAIAWLSLSATIFILGVAMRRDYNYTLFALAAATGIDFIVNITNALIEIVSANRDMTPTYFMLFAISSCSKIYFISKAIVHGRQLAGSWPNKVALSCTIILATISGGIFYSSRASTLANSVMLIDLIMHLQAISLPLIASTVIIFLDRKLHPGSSIRIILGNHPRATSVAKVELKMQLILVLTSAASIVIIAFSPELSWLLNLDLIQASSAPSLLFLTAFYYSSLIQQHDTEVNKESIVGSHLLSKATKRILNSANPVASSLTAVRASKSPTFTITHDASYSLNASLPASLITLRNYEISQFLRRMMGDFLAHQKFEGSDITGFTDAEVSLQPCIDTLILFACLQTEGIAQIERKLVVLTNLLPIIEPELSATMNSAKLRQFTSGNAWFYFCDYVWIDEHLTGSQHGLDHGILSNSNHNAFQAEVLAILSEKYPRGTFVCLSESAKERVKFEAPMLSSIIKSETVKIHNGNTHNFFVITFTDLLPRLQAYFSFDRQRHLVRDYEATNESQSLYNLFKMQLDQIDSVKQGVLLLESIATYSWQGYREKDLALSLIHALYEKHIILLSEQNLDPQQHASKAEVIRMKFLEAINAVGYPSQLLHQAQAAKFAVRNPQQLITALHDPWSHNFRDAWNYLAAFDSNRYEQEQIVAFIGAIKHVSDNRSINKQIFVMAKALEALANLGVKLQPGMVSEVNDAANSLCSWLLKNNAPVQLLSKFLDAHAYLQKKWGSQAIFIEEENVLKINSYWDLLTKNSEIPGPEIGAFVSRWQQNRATAQQAS